MSIREYSFLHISNLDMYKNPEIEYSLVNILKKLSNNEIDFVLVAGDLRDSDGSYDVANSLFMKLSDAFNINRQCFFIVPGNHDIQKDDRHCDYKDNIILNIDQDPEYYLQYYTDDYLLKPFNEFRNFTNDFYGNSSRSSEQVKVFHWESGKSKDIGLNIICINTALVGDGNLHTKEVCDINGLKRIQPSSLAPEYPTFVLAHHSINRMSVSQQKILSELFTRWNVSAYYCADVYTNHYYDVYIDTTSGNDINSISCNSISGNYSHLGILLEPSFVYFEKFPNEELVNGHVYKWSSKENCFYKWEQFEVPFKTHNRQNNGSINGSIFAFNKSPYLDMDESIWLPDAEEAAGKQTRFDSFTSTPIIDNYISDRPKFWGISAVKGIGKTFLLQVKRMKCSHGSKLCLPLGVKPSPDNRWGTDAIYLEDIKRRTSLNNFDNVVLLWQYCIILYVINQLINIRYYAPYIKIRERADLELLREIRNLFNLKRITESTLEICTSKDYQNLNEIFHGVLNNPAWTKNVAYDLPVLLLKRRLISDILWAVNKNSIAMFIDKTDQAISQTSAERPAYQYPFYGYQFDSIYASIANDDLIRKGDENRIYPNTTKRQVTHVGVWQYLQMGLMKAVYLIKQQFNAQLEIYFTIREEAFDCDDGLLGENQRKITNIYASLSYSKEEQKRIFYDCIMHQSDEFLFDPSLKSNNERIEEAFVGTKSLCHPYVVGEEETVFESIYRHSFDRSRDIQDYGRVLTDIVPMLRDKDENERSRLVKNCIENHAAKLTFTLKASLNPKEACYYDEKRILLTNYWANRENFKQLILRFKKNLFFGEEAKEFCRTYNDEMCVSDCIDCNADHHPFSMLFKIGLLGQINMQLDVYLPYYRQVFLDSRSVSYTGTDIINLNNYTIYMLHPALTKAIEQLNVSVKHFGGFIIGKDLKVDKNIVQQLYQDYKSLTQEQYERKYFFNRFE